MGSTSRPLATSLSMVVTAALAVALPVVPEARAQQAPAGAEREVDEPAEARAEEKAEERAEEKAEEQTDGEPPPADAPDPFRDLDDTADVGAAERDRRRGSQPLRQLSREELEERGFVYGDEQGVATSSTATLVALTAGLAVHGLGHVYAGDARTGYFLMAMEGISAGLMLTSALYYGFTDGSDVLTAAAAPVFQIGLGSFVYGWVLDVIGTVQGQELGLARNTHPLRGLGVRASYGFIGGSGDLPVRHVIDAGVGLDVGGVYADVATTQDVLLEASRYEATLGARPLAASRRLTHLFVEASGEYLRFDDVGAFERLEAEGRVGASFDLGTLFAHLDEVVAGLDVGYGHHWYRFPVPLAQLQAEAEPDPSFIADGGYVPARFFGHFNLTERLHLWLAYGSPESAFVPVPHRLFGNAEVRLRYRSSELGDITLGAEVGDGIALSIGGELWFWR